MLRTTIKHIAARKLRLASSGIAILLGVAFMTGTLVLTDTIGRTFDALFADVNAGIDAYVRSDQVTGDGTMAAHRGRIHADTVDVVAGVEGVAAAGPSVQGYAQLLGTDGQPIGGRGTGAPTLGGNWIGGDGLNPFRLTEGQAPHGPSEVVIDKGTARQGDLRIGDRIGVVTKAGRTDMDVVGIAKFGDADSPGGASYAMFDLPTAQLLMAAPGEIDAVRVAATPDTQPAELVQRIAAATPDGIEVLTGGEITAEDQDSVEEGLSFFNTFLLSFALISLFVGSFIIYNTFSILVAQRSRETALLRAVGASRRQILGSVIGEAVAVGLFASALGVVGGIGVARLLKALLDGMGIDIPAGGLVVTTDSLVISVAVGLVVSVASAVLPARHASRIAPVAAMRDSSDEAGQTARRRLAIGAALGSIGTAAMAAGLFSGAGIATVGTGAALTFVAVAVLGPVLARPVAGTLGAPLPRFAGLPGGLARQNAVRNPRRTSSSAAALMVGVALVGAITVLAASAKASVERTITRSFTGDVVVDSGVAHGGGLSPALAEDIARRPEAGTVAGVRFTTVDIDGAGRQVMGADPAALVDVVDMGDVSGSLSELGRAEIAVSAAAAEANGLAIGDTLTVRFAHTGAQQLRIVATYTNDDFAGDHVLGLAAYEANVADQLDTKVFVSAADGASVANLKAAVANAARAFPQATVQDKAEFAAATGKHIDQMLNLMYALLFLAILIALIGIANTLALSVIERTRELGLLRAVGMSRRQLRTTVRWESVLVALYGTVLGLAVGTGFGWALVRALQDQGVNVLRVPGAQLLAIAALAALAAVAAAIIPARRAAKLDVLRAIGA
jgi:putative ABC transport system permease protein